MAVCCAAVDDQLGRAAVAAPVGRRTDLSGQWQRIGLELPLAIRQLELRSAVIAGSRPTLGWRWSAREASAALTVAIAVTKVSGPSSRFTVGQAETARERCHSGPHSRRGGGEVGRIFAPLPFETIAAGVDDGLPNQSPMSVQEEATRGCRWSPSMGGGGAGEALQGGAARRRRAMLIWPRSSRTTGTRRGHRGCSRWRCRTRVHHQHRSVR